MMKTLILASLAILTSSAFADPQINFWVTSGSSKYARIYTSDTTKLAGTTATTWTNGRLTQSSPAYSGVQGISYSASWVYLYTSGLGPYIMGPWYDNAARTTAFVNLPTNQKLTYRIPRTSTIGTPPAQKSPSSTPSNGSPEDSVAYFVDGVAMFDCTDGFKYSNGTESGGGTGQWHRDAFVNEGITFDPGNSHEQNTGKYHNHANPMALRYLLGDHIDFNSSTKAYSESAAPVAKHSPILAWARDGYPVYGPYGYSSAMDATSGVRRMVSGFVKRDGATGGVDNITSTGRTALPAWATRNNGNIAATGPTVSTTYPLGRYIEDNAYLGDLTKPATGLKYVQGTDFDLNEYNVRYCVTPEFPAGTYAYFICIDASGTPCFPYNMNIYFFGNPTGGTVTSVSENVTSYFSGGASLEEKIITAPALSGGNVTLTWSSVEGGTYQMEASADLSNWTPLTPTITAASNAAQTSGTETSAASGSTARYYRVNRTALASYDGGTGTGGGGGGATSSETLSVSPSSRGVGTTGTISVTITATDPPLPPTGAPVASLTVGSISVTGAGYTYSGGVGTVTGTLTIPANATTGLQTVTLTFTPPSGQTAPVYTQTNGFNIQ